jgi:hypothetical protein
LTIGAVLWTPRVVKRLLGRNEEVLATETLKPGQGIVLQTIPPVTRRQKRRAKRAE